jgi:hypothetical protein
MCSGQVIVYTLILKELSPANTNGAHVWIKPVTRIAVGRPVTRPPPRRSRRAEFPHRAPQSYSHRIGSRSRPPLPSLLLTVRLASWTGPSCPGEVSCARSVTLPTPSPCTQLSRARSTMSRSDSSPAFRPPPFAVGQSYLPSTT